MRDDFSRTTKDALARRVAYKCSNPSCRRVTIGPHSSHEKFISIGVAAHITAASLGGPRFDENLSVEHRTSIANGIWLCQSCSRLIDVDARSYPPTMLAAWKLDAEAKSLREITQFAPNSNVSNNQSQRRINAYEKLYVEVMEAQELVEEFLRAEVLSEEDALDLVSIVVHRIASYTDANSFNIQDEVSLQTIGTFMGLKEVLTEPIEQRGDLLLNYQRNLRATKKLLKSVDARGMIDTSRKTPLMQYYSHMKAIQDKSDYI